MPAKIKKSQKSSKQILDSKKYTNMFDAYRAFWRRGFSEWAGTSSRSEYWFTYLMNFLMLILWLVVFAIAGAGNSTAFDDSPAAVILTLGLVMYAIAIIVPSISLLVRRLHDAGLSAWWMMLFILTLVPPLDIVASIVFFIFSVLPTKTDGNPYHKFNKENK